MIHQLPHAALATTFTLAIVLGACRRGAPTEESHSFDGTADTGGEQSPIEYAGALGATPDGNTRARLLGESEVRCVEGSNELCNAIDEDCDGRVDESDCPYSSGDVHVSIAWNGGVDVDLYVVEPGADTVSHQRRNTPSGANFDHVGRGACTSGESYAQVESVHWTGDRIRQGTYEVILHRFADCLDPPSDPFNPYTQVIVSVTVGSERLGSFQVDLAPRERVSVLRFEVAPR